MICNSSIHHSSQVDPLISCARAVIKSKIPIPRLLLNRALLLRDTGLDDATTGVVHDGELSLGSIPFNKKTNGMLHSFYSMVQVSLN